MKNQSGKDCFMIIESLLPAENILKLKNQACLGYAT